MPGLRVLLIGDYDATALAHQAIPEALRLVSDLDDVTISPEWVHTTMLDEHLSALGGADGIWCVPASPYENTTGALAAIRHARESRLPFLGTCGGFQHAVLEIASSLWGVRDALNAELDAGAVDPVIAPLACSLVETIGRVRLAPGSRIASAYASLETVEGYHCRYGLSPIHARHLEHGPLRATAWDDDGEVRAVELDDHPFFVATLFQPERAALRGEVPPLARAFVKAMR